VGGSGEEMRLQGTAFIHLSRPPTLSRYPLSTLDSTFTDDPVKFKWASIVKIGRHTMELDNRRDVERRRPGTLAAGRRPVIRSLSSLNQTWRFHHDDSDR